VTGPSAARPSDPAGRPQNSTDAMPDPWGVRRAENLLTSLEGVLSARVVTTPLGEVSEVHILAQAGLQAKQLVRNIESALLAHLGLRVDHRKISIAQTADVKPLETLDRAAVRQRSMQRTVLFESLQMQPSQRHGRVIVQVTLSCEGRTEAADEEAADTPRGKVEAAGRATVAVLDRLLSKGAMTLEGARVIQALERNVVFSSVQAASGRDTILLTGTAEVKESAERAAVFSVLDATNRWTELRRPA
jgi:hypothetical protein